MNDIRDELRALGELAEMSSRALHLRPGAVRRIRLRQVMILAFGAVVIAGLAGGSLKAIQWATKSSVLPAQAGATPGTASTGPISVAVGSETYTLSIVESGSGLEVTITSRTSEGILTSLPLTEAIKAIEFMDSLDSRDWGILGVVTSEAARVKVVVDDGRTIEATLFVLPGEAASSVKAFAAEATGQPYLSPREITVLDGSGRVIATQQRGGFVPPPVESSPA